MRAELHSSIVRVIEKALREVSSDKALKDVLSNLRATIRKAHSRAVGKEGFGRWRLGCGAAVEPSDWRWADLTELLNNWRASGQNEIRRPRPDSTSVVRLCDSGSVAVDEADLPAITERRSFDQIHLADGSHISRRSSESARPSG